MNETGDNRNGWLRHTVATLAYRGARVLRGAPPAVAGFRAADGTRTPVVVLAHIGDLLEWTLRLAQGQHEWVRSTPLAWDAEVARFYAALASLDGFLAGHAALGYPAERLFQGPIADALTHVGQLAMLRRLAGSPVRSEVMVRAEVVVGCVGPDQAPPWREFD
jgi:hypothetical protein